MDAINSATNIQALIDQKLVNMADVVVDNGDAFKVPVYPLRALEDISPITAYLKMFAERGILVHVGSVLYNNLKAISGNNQRARGHIKPLTAHNDKLGFDWRVLDKKYHADTNGKQFSISKYKDFLPKAINFNADNVAYVAHLNKITKTYNGDMNQLLMKSDGDGMLNSYDRTVIAGELTELKRML